MARRAKRATRNNPREDRNNVLELQTTRKYGSRSRIHNIEEIQPSSKLKKSVEIIPRSLNQEDMLAALEDEKTHIVFAVGPAGCGKTMLATLHAIKCLKEGTVDKIVITRPNVAVDDNDIGYLPGDIMAKMLPWMKPIVDILSEYYNKGQIAKMMEEEVIEMCPIAYIRGRTFKNCFIIFDEAQNSTPSSMLSVLTRIGEGSKMVVTGDVRQSDRNGMNNGLADLLKRFDENSTMIEVIRFDQNDIERHPVINEVLEMYKDIQLN